jgi:Fungal specific transcription factor domain
MSDPEGNIQPDDAAEDLLDKIIQKTQRLTLLDKQPQDKANRTLDAAVRFHGKSTNFYLIMATREMRMMYLLETTGAAADTVNNEIGRVATHGPDQHAQAFKGGLRRQEYWHSLDVSIHFRPRQRCSPVLVVILSLFLRYFRISCDPLCLQWELAYEGESLSLETLSELLQKWPPSDLVTALIDLYFLHCNSMFPLLHRPTFARHFADGLYERDIWFACLCMSVFALASRYTDDSRVLLDKPMESPVGEHSEQSRWQTAGFRYYFSILGKIVSLRTILKDSVNHRSGE